MGRRESANTMVSVELEQQRVDRENCILQRVRERG